MDSKVDPPEEQLSLFSPKKPEKKKPKPEKKGEEKISPELKKLIDKAF